MRLRYNLLLSNIGSWPAHHWGAGALLTVLALACSEEMQPQSREQLMDPETCKSCHPVHYRQWAGSMHAYASEDPVFVAMNRRGQREANLGEFCVNCHAPMAVREGATRDGLNLEQLPPRLRGVTCYFCHNAIGVGEPHNNSLVLANDAVMRGSLSDPLRPSAHDVAYSRYHDRNAPESSAMCGACHDIVTPAQVHLERTSKEYQESIYPGKASQPGQGFESCVSCHMEPEFGAVAAQYPGVKKRTIHEHFWPAVDVPLTEFPLREAMISAVENCALPNSIFLSDLSFQANADALGVYTVSLETQAGHSQPSGSSHDRRMWLELTTYDAGGNLLTSSGALAFNEERFDQRDSQGNAVWTLHDRIFNAAGEEAHMFWDAAPSAQFPTGVESNALPVARPGAPAHGRQRDFVLGVRPPARAEIRVRIRPVGLSVLQDLVGTGDLDPAFVDAMPTFTVASASVQWMSDRDDDFVVTDTSDRRCERYKCMLRADPNEDCSQF